MPDTQRTDSPDRDRPSIGELHRNMFALRAELVETRSQLGKLHDLAIGQALNKEKIGDHERRLDGIDATTTWLVRTVFAALILAVLGVIMGGVQL